MKKPLILVFLLIVLLSGTFAMFFFFAQSPNIENKDDYFRLYSTGFGYGSPKDTITVMTYNLGYLSGMTNNLSLDRPKTLFDDNLDKALFLFENLKPDVIGFQEIDFDADRSNNTDQLEIIANRLQYPSVYQSVNWDKAYLPFPYWPPSKHFGMIISGQALVSKYELTQAETIVLDKPDEEHLFYNSFYIDRLVQVVDMKIGDNTIKVMNLHLEAFKENLRVEQAKVVKTLFEEYAETMPVILMGDFNSNPPYEDENSLAMEVIMTAKNIKSCIDQSVYQDHPAENYTYSSKTPQIMIDYILYNENFIDCTEFRVVKEAGDISDHLPVMSKFVLK